jgi:hypothetical protein
MKFYKSILCDIQELNQYEITTIQTSHYQEKSKMFVDEKCQFVQFRVMFPQIIPNLVGNYSASKVPHAIIYLVEAISNGIPNHY